MYNNSEIIRANYLTSRQWFREALKDENAVLRYTSALECLSFFNGYMNERKIEIYSTGKVMLENAENIILPDYNDIEIVHFGELRCTSINQTFNDMLADEENADELALIEGLADYYSQNRESFEELRIEPQNKKRFQIMMEWAIDCYEGA